MQSDFETARPLLERALKIQETALGKDSPDAAAATSQLASLLAETEEYDEAEKLFENALRIQRTALGDNHTEVL